MQFSLKIVLVATAVLCAFFALVRISDVSSALMFMLMIAWMLSPVLLTFGVLYWRLKGGRRRTGRRAKR
jgi:hypothetical protein